MRVATLVTALAIAGLAAAGDSAADKKALADLQGEWKMVKAESNGKPLPEEKVARTTLVVDGNTMYFQDGEKKQEEVTITLDVSKKPHAIDITPTRKDAAKAIQGIFRREGDRLTIAFTRRGGERPTEFAAPAGGEKIVTVMELERKKK